jgi:hypothetical protein
MENKNNLEESALYCGRAIEGQVFKGETFEIQKTERGILYHCYGGYSIFVTPNNKALYQTLNEFIDIENGVVKLNDEESKDFELATSAISYILNAPRIAFSDQGFTFDLATFIVQYLQQITDEAESTPLQYENAEENAQFEDAMIAIEEIKKDIEKEHAENQGESEGEGEIAEEEATNG